MEIWVSCRECDEVFKSGSKSPLAYANSVNFEYCPSCGERN